MSTGYLPGAHEPSCPAYARIARRKPLWMAAADGWITGGRSPGAA
jgi:DNA-3-methyladenine glycosylase I